MVVVEVGGLGGAPRQRFTFGKFKYLQDEVDGVGFNGRRMRQDSSYGFSYDLQKFIEERLEPIDIQGKLGEQLAQLAGPRGPARPGRGGEHPLESDS